MQTQDPLLFTVVVLINSHPLWFRSRKADVSHAGFMILVWRLVKNGLTVSTKVTQNSEMMHEMGKMETIFALNAQVTEITDMDSHMKLLIAFR